MEDGDIEEDAHVIIDALSEAASKLGLYLSSAVLSREPSADAEHTHVLLADFIIGDRAFEAVVQDPEQHRMDTEFRGMKLDAEKDEFRDIARQLRERLDKEEWEDPDAPGR